MNNAEGAGRLLNDHEIEAVNGGLINDGGCIVLPGLPNIRVPEVGQYHDVFASILPGWVQHPPR
jgi:hypothetical protein